MLASGSLDGFLGIWSLPVARFQVDGQICAGSTLSPLSTAYLLEDCIKAVLQAANPAGGDYFIYGQVSSSSANECQMLQNVGTCETLQAASYTMYRLEPPLKHMVQAHGGAVRALEPLPQQGGLVASGGDDGTIRSWSPSSGTMVQDFGNGQALANGAVTALAYSSSLEALVAASLFQVAFFEIASGSVLRLIDRSTSSPALLLSLGSEPATASENMEQWGQLLSSKGHLEAQYPVPCTEMEVWPQLTLCQDGSAPSSFSQCEPCAAGTAGTGGACDEVCGPGTQSTGTQCVACLAGQAGDGSTCQDCLPGEFQAEPGQVTCRQCPRGFAQPAPRATGCEPCDGNAAATRLGSELCVPCPDSTEPSVDHTECLTCLQGTAGRDGVCEPCLDGEQTSADSTSCLPCPTGTAGTQGFCSLCPEGSEPDAARVACVPCASGFAGANGVCQRCAPGEEPDAASALCVACAPGRAGANGTCSFCPMGTVQSPDRSMCIFCSEGFIAFQAACSICPDGSQPSSNRSVCVPCPPGFAGTEGLCSLCPEGTGASVDHASCETCLEGFYGSEGLCGQCPNGTRPRNRTEEARESARTGTETEPNRCELGQMAIMFCARDCFLFR
ncbi:CUB and EGF-like domain-containing protein 2 (Protein CEGP1) (Scube/You) [Durusdinium trenchii]|uniref:CUB and EGF-like domain-containing protein 2 (Protein CEGP1) (Scube/You) n=1 Tax=Durusdinium trenchii TaxID=1381693 RepID=A0ABP0MWT0_9DINO